MKFYKTYTFWFAMFLILIFLIGIIVHELSHQVITEEYGGSSKIDLFSKFPLAVTYNTNCIGDCQLAQAIDEAFTYNLYPLEMIIGLGLLFIIMILEDHFREDYY